VAGTQIRCGREGRVLDPLAGQNGRRAVRWEPGVGGPSHSQLVCPRPVASLPLFPPPHCSPTPPSLPFSSIAFVPHSNAHDCSSLARHTSGRSGPNAAWKVARPHWAPTSPVNSMGGCVLGDGGTDFVARGETQRGSMPARIGGVGGHPNCRASELAHPPVRGHASRSGTQ
jgi:hypothetical protein